MGPFEIAAIAIIGSFIVKIADTWIKTRGGSSEAQKRIVELEQRVQALEAGQPTQALESRLHVLEEIVTTDEFELQQKFKQLEREKSVSADQ